jgi:hypothetical protein
MWNKYLSKSRTLWRAFEVRSAAKANCVRKIQTIIVAKNTKCDNGVTKFTDYSENTCPGGNKSGASVSIILSTSSLAVFCKAYTAGKKLSWENGIIEETSIH